VIPELLKSLLYGRQGRVAVMTGCEWDILDEFVHGDAVGPRVAGCEIPGAGGPGQRFDDGHGKSGAGKEIQPTDAKFTGEWNTAQGDSQWNGLTAKRACIHQYESIKAFRQRTGAAHADGPAPVMAEQGDVLQVEQLHEVPEATDVMLECIERAAGGFLGEAAAEVVDGNDTKAIPEGRDEPSPGEAPCGIAVDHQERRSGTFVDVVLDAVGGTEPLRLEWVFAFEAATIPRPLKEVGRDVGAGEDHGSC